MTGWWLPMLLGLAWVCAAVLLRGWGDYLQMKKRAAEGRTIREDSHE
jgi:hypothetical protein